MLGFLKDTKDERSNEHELKMKIKALTYKRGGGRGSLSAERAPSTYKPPPRIYAPQDTGLAPVGEDGEDDDASVHHGDSGKTATTSVRASQSPSVLRRPSPGAGCPEGNLEILLILQIQM